MTETKERLYLQRPRLTAEQVSMLKIGQKVRDIPGQLYHVAGFVSVDGFGGGDVAVLATWLKHKGWWRYTAATFQELTILYTPE